MHDEHRLVETGNDVEQSQEEPPDVEPRPSALRERRFERGANLRDLRIGELGQRRTQHTRGVQRLFVAEELATPHEVLEQREISLGEARHLVLRKPELGPQLPRKVGLEAGSFGDLGEGPPFATAHEPAAHRDRMEKAAFDRMADLFLGRARLEGKRKQRPRLVRIRCRRVEAVVLEQLVGHPKVQRVGDPVKSSSVTPNAETGSTRNTPLIDGS